MTKNQQFLLYIISKRIWSTITEILKLAYLIDLAFYRMNWNKISEYKYIRYYYWPYDKSIDNDVHILLEQQRKIDCKVYNTSFGDTIAYFNDSWELFTPNLADEEIEFINTIMEEIGWLGSKQLTEVSYATKPMKKFNAVLWGREHLMEELDFDA